MTWLAVHVLLVSPVWFVGGSGSDIVSRNITSRLPASATFAAADSLGLAGSGPDSLSPGGVWRACGTVPALPWAAPTDYDIRTDILALGACTWRKEGASGCSFSPTHLSLPCRSFPRRPQQ